MRGYLVPGALGAMLVAGLAGSVEADETSVCTKSENTLTITIPAGVSSAELDKGAGGHVIVRFGDAAAACDDASGDSFVARSFKSIELGQDGGSAPTAWLLSKTEWDPTITLHDEPVDTLELAGSAGADTWRALPGDQPSLSLDSDAADDLLLDAMPSSATFETDAGDDVVDLADGWTSSTSIATGSGNDTITGGDSADEIAPGVGADTVAAGPGDDRVSIDADAGPDTARPGEGDDELALSAAGSTSGVTVDPTEAGGDGTAGNDTYGTFETVLGTGRADRFVAPPDGMTAVGGAGSDTFVSGAGDDTFHGGTVDSPTEGMGTDTVSYAAASAGVRLAPTAEPGVEQATGAGADRLTSVERLTGSPHADRVQTATIGRVRPGPGNDRVGFDGFKGYIIAEPGRDGNDASLSCATWDYSRRTAPLSLTANGIANDGLRGEDDNVGANCRGVTILGGSGADRIVGDAGRNVVAGSAGADRILGKSRGDYLWGGAGADQLTGGDGADDVAGGKGNDRIREIGRRPNGADVLHGNTGRDTLTYSGRISGVTVSNGNLRCDDGADGERDCVTRHDPFEVIFGTSSTDRLFSSGRDERFFGGRGPDVLRGNRGSDGLFGGGGNDRLTGGPGKDTHQGGSGGDRFYAKDSTKDILRGGYGKDLARRDRVDTAYSVEGRF